MVKQAVRFISREFSFNQAAFLIGFFALLSQILGLLRDRSLAHFLGPSSSLDIYYAAFRIPDFIFISVASLASFTVLIPFLASKIKNGKDQALGFLSNVFSIFLIVIIVVGSVAFIIMPFLTQLIAPGFSPEMIKETTILSRIMLLSPILLGLSNLLGSVTQILNRFFIYALSPILYNLGILIGVIFFLPTLGLKGLALGVVLGALLHMLIQLPVLIREGFLPKFTFKINFKEIKETVLLSLPRTLALSANNLSLIAILAIASLISEGSISIFNFAMNLQIVPVTLFGVSYSVAIFPTLAKSYLDGDINSYIEKISNSARQIIFWSTPVIFLFIVLRAQIVRVVLGSGRFTWSDTKLTAAALALFAVSILAQSLTLLLIRGYYAAGKTTKPLYVNLIFSVLSIFLALFLVKIYQENVAIRDFFESLLRIESATSSRVVMLPLAYSIGTILNFAVLWKLFRIDFKSERLDGVWRVFWQSLTASLALGVVSYFALNLLDNVFNVNTFWGILGQGFLSGIMGTIAAVFVLYMLKSRELYDFWQTIHSRFWRVAVISPAQENLQNIDKV